MNNLQKLILILIIILGLTLRFYKLGVNPPGLYWDEAAFGYDAYSILVSAKDHHGRTFPLFFESFGDWKLPVYVYLLVPTIKVFGLTEFAVRFPSAFFGSLTIIVFFFLIKKLTSNITLALASAFLLAISPWHIQFSRGGFESTPGLFFLSLAVLLFLEGNGRKSSLIFTLSFLLFALSMYSYHAYRIFTPLIIASFSIIYFAELKKNLNRIVLPVVLAFVLLLPLSVFTFSSEGKARAISQTLFHKEEFERERIIYDQSSKKSLRFLSKYWRKPFYYSYRVINGYLDHFSPRFLFFKGDQIGRHSLVEMGQIFGFEIILLAASLLATKTLSRQAKLAMLSWLLISPIPATIVTPTPHAYRTLQMSLPLAFFSAVGLYYIFSQRFFLVKFGLISVILYSLLTSWHLRFIHYPKAFSADWQDGYKQMVREIQKFQDSFDKVYVTNINQVPYIYLLFYQHYSPQKFLSERGTRDAFGKYFFISQDTNIYDKGRILYVAPSWEKVDGKWLAAANDSNGRHLYSLWEIND